MRHQTRTLVGDASAMRIGSRDGERLQKAPSLVGHRDLELWHSLKLDTQGPEIVQLQGTFTESCLQRRILRG
jgi:hypothetical protein